MGDASAPTAGPAWGPKAVTQPPSLFLLLLLQRDAGGSTVCDIMRESGWSYHLCTHEYAGSKSASGVRREGSLQGVLLSCSVLIDSPALLPSNRLWGYGKADRESPSESPLVTAPDPSLCSDQQLDDGFMLGDGRKGNCS